MLLMDRARPVQDLAGHFDLQRPSVSEHLRVLRNAGLVTETRHGRQRIYTLRPEPLRAVVMWLRPFDEFWRGRLRDLEALLAEDES
jgi:DNA-binding transcriptional ArsR family regulator